jgi:hypothetical protein
MSVVKPDSERPKIDLASIAIPAELAIGDQITYDQWRAGRRIRREISDLISSEECGKDTSDDDALLRAKYDGRRNSPFTPTEELPGISLYELLKDQERPASE